ncbi:hypothetical protein GUJ93_ZPchr0654g29142 [Zizania palustris]|uniref:Pentatricopeptide repeat-containing protein n=1 Tax=Zizania palustris TaxID=103762 RepID=A0A8J5QWU1_ZIZPA|nr:hypothetical protein GUJ93_ZPchr0654g29142 [Zizania palustris]
MAAAAPSARQMSHTQFIELLRRGASYPRHGEALHALAVKFAAFAVFADILPAARDVASWNSLLNPLSRHRPLDALSYFRSMISSSTVLPSPHSFAAAFTRCRPRVLRVHRRCGTRSCLEAGPWFDGELGLEVQIYVKSALVDMYAKCGCIDDAKEGFDQLYEVDIVLWTTMVAGHVQNGEHEEALTLIGAREAIAHANLEVWVWIEVSCWKCLVYNVFKCGNLEDGISVFKRMPDRDVIAWNSIISGFSQNGCGNGALDLF